MVFIHINNENTHVFNLFNPCVSFFGHFAGLLSFWPVGQWLQLPDFASFGCGGTTLEKPLHKTQRLAVRRVGSVCWYIKRAYIVNIFILCMYVRK